MELERRTVLIAVAAVLVLGTGVVTATGSLGTMPVVGPLLTDPCGPGETRIAAINDGGSVGETVVIKGKLDYSLQVDETGIVAFNLDGPTGTVPVYLERSPDENLDFGGCLQVRGVVTSGTAKQEVDGPIVVNATVRNR